MLPTRSLIISFKNRLLFKLFVRAQSALFPRAAPPGNERRSRFELDATLSNLTAGSVCRRDAVKGAASGHANEHRVTQRPLAG